MEQLQLEFMDLFTEYETSGSKENVIKINKILSRETKGKVTPDQKNNESK